MRIIHAIGFCMFFLSSTAQARELALTSWYGPGFEHRRMADGRLFSASDPSIAAHRTLPFGTRLRLTNPENGHSIVVTIQDRGPFHHGRSLDISKAAAELLGFMRQGTAVLAIETLDTAQPTISPEQKKEERPVS